MFWLWTWQPGIFRMKQRKKAILGPWPKVLIHHAPSAALCPKKNFLILKMLNCGAKSMATQGREHQPRKWYSTYRLCLVSSLNTSHWMLGTLCWQAHRLESVPSRMGTSLKVACPTWSPWDSESNSSPVLEQNHRAHLRKIGLAFVNRLIINRFISWV